MENTSQNQEISDHVYKNRYIISTIVLIGVLMSILDGYMVTIALPTITTQFNIDVGLSQWIITGYLVVMTALFIFFGKISEYTGKTKLFLMGWILFTLSSLGCGLSFGITELIIFRIVQAIGASMIAGVSGAILFHAFPPNEVGKAMGYFGATLAVGSLIGPGLGGFITNFIGWQYIFLVNVPLGVVLILGALKYLKIPENTSKNLNIDWIGTITFVISVATLIMFCGELANSISFTMYLVMYGVVFLLSTVIFIIQESKCKDPMLDLSIFKNRDFSLPVLSLLIFSIALNMAIIVGPFYFQGVMDYNPSQVGLFFMIVSLAMVVTSPIGGKLYDKYHSKYASGIAVLISTVSFVLLGYAYLIMNISMMIIALILWGIGNGLFTSPNTTETLSALPREKTAIASSVSTTAKSLGGALGVSFVSIFLTMSLSTAGYNGEILLASQSILSNSISTIMFATGFLCILATITTVLRNINRKSVLYGELNEMQEFSSEKHTDD
ncbi:MFS transporter [Methanobrevibacter sp. TMH8]|uniref:MFS transporter n=1 Tax=Methanobrevibacter sp. TMH8 TaxID=2848611 RepID=UPI001CC9E970|nr:MFS transporter [Methanobrevibacter sp. TMH8]MBZ9570836.1 MFS transporter [Methanobrevibacter sp. TMH8]